MLPDGSVMVLAEYQPILQGKLCGSRDGKLLSFIEEINASGVTSVTTVTDYHMDQGGVSKTLMSS